MSIGPDCLIGARVPDFEVELIDGSKYSSENLKGKVSVINFWFIDCPPCVAEINGLNSLVKLFGKNKLNYIAIGRDQRSDIESFLKNNVWNYKHISGETKIIDNIFKLYWGYPTTFVLNKQTEIIYATSGGKSDSTASQELLDKLIPIIKSAIEVDGL
ncbi:MAG: TlpA family protein disulfide reductase [Saprospiraceae bacterium]|nr:TlpA family protein disulfide reductase [Candidatus Vicinibacter proximus]